MLFLPVSGQKIPDSESPTLLAKAADKAAEYSNAFKNLTVEETKFFENFDEKKRLKNSKTILSDLIIYESENNPGNLSEFRNVRAVNGKKIKNGDRRTVRIFAELTTVRSFEEELKKLNQESSRYDGNISVHGLTLNQALPLASNFIPSFDFQEIGSENIGDRETVVIKFHQTAVNPSIKFNFNAPDILEISKTFYRGTVWLDLKNHRILKLVTETILDSVKFTEPFIAMKSEYQYQPSDFEIYVPRKIIIENYNPQIKKSARVLLKTGKIDPGSQLQSRLTLEYKNFSKFDVTVKSK